MPTEIRYIGNMPVEERQLDGAGEDARATLNACVLEAYKTDGLLGGEKLCEAVQEFEKYASDHVLPE